MITDNRYILDIVENGYKIPFKTQPEQMYINNKKSWLKNKDFVASEITNLLNKGIKDFKHTIIISLVTP